MSMSILVITGTGTEVGKTVTTAAVAAAALAAGRSVAVLKAAQTGVRPDEPGDAAEVARLAGAVTATEIARYPEPLAPGTAARRAGMTPVRPQDVAEAAAKLATEHDLVLVEGAGGLLVRFDPAGGTLADAAELLRAPVLVVACAGLGTLNTTELTARELRLRRLDLAGIVIGSWPDSPIWPRVATSRTCRRCPAPRCSARCPPERERWHPPTSVRRRRVGWRRDWTGCGTRRLSACGRRLRAWARAPYAMGCSGGHGAWARGLTPSAAPAWPPWRGGRPHRRTSCRRTRRGPGTRPSGPGRPSLTRRPDPSRPSCRWISGSPGTV